MPGVLNYSRYIDLLYTVKDVIGHFPLEQLTLTYDFDGQGADGWTGQMSWQTLIIDQFRYRFGEPYFDDSQVIGYFPGGNKTFAVVGQLQLPAYMYQGPIIPESYTNVPITVVEFEFTKGTEVFSKQLLLIENWHPGIALGNPTLDPNYTPISGLTSTLTLTASVDSLMIGDTFNLTAVTDITDPLSPTAAAKFYRKTGPTTQTLLGSALMVGQSSTLSVSTALMSTGTNTFFATFNGGNPQYGLTQSNNVSIQIVEGNPLDVSFSISPSSAVLDQTVISTATATSLSTSSQFIANSTTFTVQALGTNSGESQTPFSSTGNFVNGSTSTSFTITSSYLPTNINSATYTVNSVTSNGVNATFNTVIVKTYEVKLSWGSVFSQRIKAGTTSTVLTVSTTQNIVQALEPITVSVIDTQQNQTTDQVYNNTPLRIQATSNVGRNQGLSAGAVIFEADYSPNYNIQNYVVARTPVVSTATSSGILDTPIYLESNQVLLQNPNNVRLGATMKFPGTPDSIGPRNTGTFTITQITPITSGTYNGSVLITLDRNWTTSPYSSVFRIFVPGQLQTSNEIHYGKAWAQFAGPIGYSGFNVSTQYGWAWCSIWVDGISGNKFIVRRGRGSTDASWSSMYGNNFIPPPSLGRLGYSESELKSTAQGNYYGYQTGYWIHLIWSVDLQVRGQRGFAGFPPNPNYYFVGSLANLDWRNVTDTPTGGINTPRTISPNNIYEPISEPFPLADRAEIKIEKQTFTYNRYQDVLVGLFTSTISSRNLVDNPTPTGPNEFTIAPRKDVYDIPNNSDPNSVYSISWATVSSFSSPYQIWTIENVPQTITEYVWKTNRLTDLRNYTVNDQGQIQEKDQLFFTSLGAVTTGSTFSFAGLINTGTTATVYTVFEMGTNTIRVDPPWYNHIPTNYSPLNGKTLTFTNPIVEDQRNYSVTQITEMKYVGLGVPYYTGAYTFNKVKFSDSSKIFLNTTFKLQGGPRSPIGQVFTIVAAADNEGFYTISPAYSITNYVETETWRRDNEIYTNFLNFERNRNIVFYTSPFDSSLIKVRSATGTNTLILENIPSGLLESATFNSTLTNFSGTYTVTTIDPFRETIQVTPSWTAGSPNLAQWAGKSFSYTNPILSTSTIILGTATTITVDGNFQTTWARSRTVEPGTYSIRAKLTPQFQTGNQAPFRYATTSTVNWTLQSSPGLIAPLDLELRAISFTQSEIRLICRGSTSIDPANYYVFDQPVEFYNNGNLLTTSSWTRTPGALEQRATATIFNSQIGSIEARWAGSMNYPRTSPDQILFQPSILIL